jgi:hypothetical protein
MMVGSSRSGEAVVTKEPSPPISAIAARRPFFGLAFVSVLLFFIRQPRSAVTMGAMLLLLLLVVLASVETAVVVPVV